MQSLHGLSCKFCFKWGEYGSIHPLHPELTTCRGHAYVLDIWKGPRVVGLYRKGWGANQYWQWHEYGNKLVSKWTGVSKDHLENCLEISTISKLCV